MNTRKLTVATAALLLLAMLTGAAVTGVFTQLDTSAQGTETTEIVTASATQSDQYGLLPFWQRAYNGTGTASHDYRLNNSPTNVTQECGNCHMSAGGPSNSKHMEPLHPIGLNSTDTGSWFFDDGLHRGPNTQLATQLAGITLSGNPVNCGDCHTPTNASGFGDAANSGRTSDPHSVHRDVMSRVGCIRCHNYDNVTFATGETWQFTQSNATRTTYGIANPINMTRAWDGKFLSTAAEATYDANLNPAGSGWNRYGTTDANASTQYGCGDCHDQYHASGGLGFTFDDSASSRKGPLALVNHTNSIGISSGGNDFTCGSCHVTDAHAVHTNGGIVTVANYTYVNQTAVDPSVHNSSARGAEYCDECHSVNVYSFSTFDNATNNHHQSGENPEKRGLAGPKDNLPDAASFVRGAGYNGTADCGFCHR